MSKLTEDDIKQIYVLAHTGKKWGFTVKKIGSIYNITRQTVSYIKNKKRYENITDNLQYK